MDDQARQGRKRGRPAEPGLMRYNLLLDEGLAEWGKARPGGLSRLVRELLRREREREERSGRRGQ